MDIINGHKVGIILGARQVGKTTLVEHVVRERGAVFLNFDIEVYFWRSRAQSKVDLVVKQGDALRAFEIKWSGRRAVKRAFRDAYGVNIEIISPANPFVAELLDADTAHDLV